jgi:hypothetical protein
MAPREQHTPALQRNAFAPGILVAAVLFLSPVILKTEWSAIVLYVVSIGALMVAAVAVLWNPVFPFGFGGTIWTLAQFVAAVVFLVAGVLIKSPRV